MTVVTMVLTVNGDNSADNSGDNSADVNKNDCQDKFAGYGIHRFQNQPTNQNENKPNGPPKLPKSIVYTLKTALLDLKHFVLAKLNLKIALRVFESESTLFEPKYFIPDN